MGEGLAPAYHFSVIEGIPRVGKKGGHCFSEIEGRTAAEAEHDIAARAASELKGGSRVLEARLAADLEACALDARGIQRGDKGRETILVPARDEKKARLMAEAGSLPALGSEREDGRPRLGDSARAEDYPAGDRELETLDEEGSHIPSHFSRSWQRGP
jgi:hypothetical protein